MNKGNVSKGRQFAILGLGRFGRSILKTLSDNGCSVLACDSNLDIVQEMSQYATHVVQVDVRDEMSLESLGLGNFDVVIVAIGGDLEACVMATLISKQAGAKYVIAKVQNQMQKKILERVGADRVVLPEWEMGVKIATNLVTSNIIDFINLSEEYSIAELEPVESWVDLSLQKANIRAVSGLNIVAIKRGKKIIVSPKPDEIIMATDIIVAIGENSDIQRFSSNTKIKGGGGLF